ncbi:MAG: sigma-70 family RNA polymerase sigma factor [Sedimentisphaerales bacterium]|nr:sigma-70 family RNA polymerase sigma factor [Sedimentisphaerales bacterium]
MNYSYKELKNTAGWNMDNKDKLISVSDSKSFLSLLRRCQTQIHTYILCQVPNRNDAEDILQDTIVVMLDKFSEYREGTSFLAWGIAIARNKIKSFKYKNRNSKMIFDDSIGRLLEQEASKNPEFFQDESRVLKGCVEKLEPKHKRYLLLRYEQDMTYREIGRQFNVSMQAVYKMMTRIQLSLLHCVRLSLQRESSL